jgi:hypothetical protein
MWGQDGFIRIRLQLRVAISSSPNSPVNQIKSYDEKIYDSFSSVESGFHTYRYAILCAG